jgi:hypothetical protein
VYLRVYWRSGAAVILAFAYLILPKFYLAAKHPAAKAIKKQNNRSRRPN